MGKKAICILVLIASMCGCSRKESDVARDEAIAVIEKLGGSVQYDEKIPGRPIVKVVFTGLEVTDAHLVHFKGLTSLE